METRPPSTVVITGASAGVGRAAASAFARRGCNVGLIARDADRLEAARTEVEAAGGRGLALPADVADAEAVDAAAERAERELGPIDVWVNCAMVTMFAPFAAMTSAEYRRVTEVTYLGYVHGTMAALRRMRPRDWGTIVQVGSALSYRAIPLQSAYCGAKHAIRGFTDSIRSELIHDGSMIRLSMVQLPAVNTPQFDWARNRMPRRPRPVAPVYEPELAAEAIVRAAEACPRELWVAPSSLKVIAGNMLVPGWLDHKLAKAAYTGQQTKQPADAGRPDNLFEPVPGDFGAHGRFGAEASRNTLTLASGSARMAAALAATGLAVAAFLLALSANRRIAL